MVLSEALVLFVAFALAVVEAGTWAEVKAGVRVVA